MGRFDPVYKPTVTFASGESESSATNISKLGLRGLCITVPSGWTAADIGFQVSDDVDVDTATWETLYKINSAGDGTEGVKVVGILTSAVGRYEVPPQIWMAGNARWIRLLSRDTSDFTSAVNQTGGDKIITLGTLA